MCIDRVLFGFSQQGTIVEWLKVVGDPVKVDDVVALVETDKVGVENDHNPDIQ